MNVRPLTSVLQLELGRAYQVYLNKHLDWRNSFWLRFTSLYRLSRPWVPALPGIWRYHVPVVSALNLTGGYLIRLLGLCAFDFFTSPSCKAESLPFLLEVPRVSFPFGAWKWIVDAYSTVINIVRIFWLCVLFAPVLCSCPLALVLDFKRAEWLELLRMTLEAAGPAFIKWGQWAATRHDLFAPDLCLELEKMQTKAPAHKFKHTRKAIETAFGGQLSDFFESLDEEPVASGSIGQIHRAVLNESGAMLTGFPPGSVVAVKVRHPGVGQAILRDFSMMLAAAQMLSHLPALRDLRLEDTLRQFAAPLREQVDLAQEARNLVRFNHNFRRTRHVTFPMPLYPLVSQDVLLRHLRTAASSHTTSCTPTTPSHRDWLSWAVGPCCR